MEVSRVESSLLSVDVGRAPWARAVFPLTSATRASSLTATKSSFCNRTSGSHPHVRTQPQYRHAFDARLQGAACVHTQDAANKKPTAAGNAEDDETYAAVRLVMKWAGYMSELETDMQYHKPTLFRNVSVL
ncbi:hypothetical protein LTR66_009585 [Elasticomyces elasticus]|nr:hypothetical protein LTR66_009585 [Elasticomyces elasticus]